jgi:tetratricopeptide (TPR) repeat protein
MSLWLALLACAPEPAPVADDPCALAFLPTDGPLAAQAAKETDPVKLALLRIREAGLTADPGYHTLAELALRCALERDPGSVEAQRWLGFVEIQFHRFAEAEDRLGALEASTHYWRDALLLGDARMEQGDLRGAAEAYDRAMVRPGLETYDRVANLAWLTGDLDRAIELQRKAVDAATPDDPEPMAWVLTRLGVLKSLRGEVPNELGLALGVLPGYRPAELALGRWMLATGRPDLAEVHLRAAGPTVEATRALAELDPTASVEAVKSQDRRGYAIWLADRDPAGAVALLDAELRERQDAITVVARAWAGWKGGQDTRADVRDALATGIADPATLVRAAEVLSDPAIAARALALSPGLLPSERIRAQRLSAGK